MPSPFSYPSIKDASIKAGYAVGALAGRFIVPSYAAAGTRAALNLWPVSTTFLGRTVVENASYYAFGATIGCGGIVGGVVGAAATQVAFKGFEYAAGQYQNYSQLKALDQVEKSGLDWDATPLVDDEEDNSLDDDLSGDKGWSTVDPKNALDYYPPAALSSSSRSSSLFGFGSFFYDGFSKLTSSAKPAEPQVEVAPGF